MVRIRDESRAQGDANLLPASVADIARSLRLARQAADLSVPEAAAQAGLGTATVEALESGVFGPQHDRIDTLRALRTYALTLGLPGDDFVLVAVERWSVNGPVLIASGDTAVVPLVSISSAPAGGHAPASSWPGDATGVTDTTTTTGVIEHIPPLAFNDTGRVPMVDTGQVPAVRLGVPRALKISVVVAAVLVALGGAALVEHNNLRGWVNNGQHTAVRWYQQAESALGITSKPTSHSHGASTNHSPAAHLTDSVRTSYKLNPGGRGETMNVTSNSFTVRVVAVKYNCWVQATALGQSQPLFAQVLPAGQTHTFTVTSSLTIDTGSSAGRAFIYKGNKLIGFFFPSKVPFLMTFNAVN
jgi:hypothetical protein